MLLLLENARLSATPPVCGTFEILVLPIIILFKLASPVVINLSVLILFKTASVLKLASVPEISFTPTTLLLASIAPLNVVVPPNVTFVSLLLLPKYSVVNNSAVPLLGTEFSDIIIAPVSTLLLSTL